MNRQTKPRAQKSRPRPSPTESVSTRGIYVHLDSNRVHYLRVLLDEIFGEACYLNEIIDGSIFNVALSDIPERKTDLVAGKYELAIPSEKTTLAVKLIDMLGEEVLVVQTV